MAKKTDGYVQGGDVIVSIDGKAAGHSTGHTTTYGSETKDVAVKPKSTEKSSGLFGTKIVTKLNVQVKVDGLKYYGEDESGIKTLLNKWKTGDSVELTGFPRGNDTNPYMSGSFIISSIEDSSPAGENSSYSATFDSTGDITIDEDKIDGTDEE